MLISWNIIQIRTFQGGLILKRQYQSIQFSSFYLCVIQFYCSNITWMQKVQKLLNTVFKRNQDALESLGTFFNTPHQSLTETFLSILEQGARLIAEKQQYAFQSLSKLGQQVTPEILQKATESIEQRQQNSIRQFNQAFQQGNFALDWADSQSTKKQNEKLKIQKKYDAQLPTNKNLSYKANTVNLSQVKKVNDYRNNYIVQNHDDFYRKQFKTRDDKKQNGNNFEKYKQQLINYENSPISKTDKISKKRMGTQQKARDQGTPNKMQKSNEIQRKSRIIRLNESSVRKHSLKREKEAENQLKANIQFLRNIKGTSSESPKKEWKQDSQHIRTTLQQLKQSKRKQMQLLGFTDSSRIIQSKLGDSTLLLSPQRVSYLPEIKQSKKKGHIFKPTAFSIYTIQKDNEIFYNKLPM